MTAIMPMLRFQPMERWSSLARNIIAKYQMTRYPEAQSVLLFLRLISGGGNIVPNPRSIHRISTCQVAIRIMYCRPLAVYQKRLTNRNLVRQVYMTGRTIRSELCTGSQSAVRGIPVLQALSGEVKPPETVLGQAVFFKTSMIHTTVGNFYTESASSPPGLLSGMFSIRGFTTKKGNRRAVDKAELVRPTPLTEMVLGTQPAVRTRVLSERDGMLQRPGTTRPQAVLWKAGAAMYAPGCNAQKYCTGLMTAPDSLYSGLREKELAWLAPLSREASWQGTGQQTKTETVPVDSPKPLTLQSSGISGSCSEMPTTATVEKIADQVLRLLEKRKAIERDRRGGR